MITLHELDELRIRFGAISVRVDLFSNIARRREWVSVTLIRWGAHGVPLTFEGPTSECTADRLTKEFTAIEEMTNGETIESSDVAG